MVRVNRIAVQVSGAVPSALLFPLLGARMAGAAQALQVAIEEQVRVAAMRYYVIGHSRDHGKATSQATTTQGVSG